jgi:hypothetical protein
LKNIIDALFCFLKKEKRTVQVGGHYLTNPPTTPYFVVAVSPTPPMPSTSPCVYSINRYQFSCGLILIGKCMENIFFKKKKKIGA